MVIKPGLCFNACVIENGGKTWVRVLMHETWKTVVKLCLRFNVCVMENGGNTGLTFYCKRMPNDDLKRE